jgi:hypothetical protein
MRRASVSRPAARSRVDVVRARRSLPTDGRCDVGQNGFGDGVVRLELFDRCIRLGGVLRPKILRAIVDPIAFCIIILSPSGCLTSRMARELMSLQS